MATTVPCVLRALGNRNPTGFTKADVLAAFINAGYNPEKAFRRYRQCAASHQIVKKSEDGSTEEWITPYCPTHLRMYPDDLTDIEILAVKIERDGTVTYL